MTTTDPLQCSFDDARHNLLREGIALSTRAKVEYFEEMAEFALHFGARDRLAVREPGSRAEDEPGNSRR